ncbi:MAG: glycosyltransferase [Oscillospiraceae bacterium]|nr:glycosyltransferase [Oscillospiraceae bacterium]
MIRFQLIFSLMNSIPYKVFNGILFALSIYLLMLSIFGIFKRKPEKISDIKHRFLILSCAHDEELVITDLINSVFKLDYDKNLYKLFIVADNCTDDTESRARSIGANVLVRNNNLLVGKGYALEWAFKKLDDMNEDYDAVVIVDADNLLHRNFLKEMNESLNEGFDVVQCFADSKNPYDSYMTAWYSISAWMQNRIFQLSRYNLHLSNQLTGFGFAMKKEILKRIGWRTTSLVEDLEFTCKLVLNNYKVGYSHNAIIYDEKPITMKDSVAQRKRWMQGFADVCVRNFPKLIKKGFREFDLKAIDCAIYIAQPFTLTLFGINYLLHILSKIIYFLTSRESLLNLVSFDMNITRTSSVVSIGTLLIAFMQIIYPIIIMILDKKLSIKSLWYYLFYSLYMITWFPIVIQGIINRNSKVWLHTKHFRKINIDNIND